MAREAGLLTRRLTLALSTSTSEFLECWSQATGSTKVDLITSLLQQEYFRLMNDPTNSIVSQRVKTLMWNRKLLGERSFDNT